MTDPAAWGVAPGYADYSGRWREAPPETVEAVLAAMGADQRAGPPGVGPEGRVLVAGTGEPVALPGRWHLRTEEGAELEVDGALPAGLAPGYHQLAAEDGNRTLTLILSPRTCPLPGVRTWGWAVQLYAARSRSSWGMGDLADLRRLARWSATQGAGMALVNPLHAPHPGLPQQASPYSPSSRCYRNPLYLRVEDVPGSAASAADLERLAAAGRALNADRLIDRDAVWRLKMTALEALWAGFAGDPDFDRYRGDEGAPLAGFATFCALVERHGSPWTSWPAGLQEADGPDVAAFARAHADRVRFHEWLQWLLDGQLARAGAEIDLVTDLAIGVDPVGADAWLWRRCLAPDVRVGAPPDEFAPSGQDWGLPPFDPWRLRACAYEPFIRTLRAGFRHAGGLRIDHVMGLFRLFWIPLGVRPADGVYVRYPWQELLDIVALESSRAGAWVVGEDLGTVEAMVREELARRRVLSYRLVWFEDRPPREFPTQALAAVSTHDLPTVVGLASGTDLAEQQRLGLGPNAEATAAMWGKVAGWAGIGPGANGAEVVRAVHRLLAEAPSLVVSATLDDALAVPERPNMPGGTDDRRPNWRLALPRPLEDVESDPLVAAVAAALADPGT